MKWCADFETTTNVNDCRVWCYGLSNIENPDVFLYGYTIDDLMAFCDDYSCPTLYFHNLKFDGEFIFVWLFEHGYTHVTRKELAPKTFTTLISDSGQFYSIEIMFRKRSKVKIYDSLKIIPLSVAVIAKSFDLPISKLDMDYNKYRPPGYVMDLKEIDYLRNDVEIVARALATLFDQGLDRMTQGSNALANYKETIGTKNFKKWFPVPSYDTDVRKSYRGGYVYANKKFKGKDVGKGIVLDVNSLYPAVMYNDPMPYGEGVYFDGEYVENKLYPLYVQRFSCQFDLKKGMLPTIQLKNNLSFVPTEYVESSGEKEIDLCMTSVDIKLFFKHYDIYNIEYLGGWMFKSSTDLFKKYIDKWIKVKNDATLSGNKGMRTLAKLMLNSLYGKFALNPVVQSKIPEYREGTIGYITLPPETREPIYIPAGTFITSWARHHTIISAQKVYDRFLYADTDSLHLIGTEAPEGLEIDAVKLGTWKHESSFDMARFIRAKSYIERERAWRCEDRSYIDGMIKKKERTGRQLVRYHFKPGWKPCEHSNMHLSDLCHIKVTCAGLPEKCHDQVTWENFRPGASYDGKLTFKHCKGGVVLIDTDFTIKS